MPKFSLPKISLPKIEVPKIEIPKIQPTLPKFEVPKIQPVIPKFEVPKVQPIQVKIPEPPKIQPPKINLPKITPPKINVPPIRISIPEPPKVNVPKIQIPKIEPQTLPATIKPVVPVQPIQITKTVDQVKQGIANIVEKRDAIYERGSLPEVGMAMMADIALPLDLAKVLTKGADSPEDYLWAGVDVLGLIPVIGWGAKGVIKGIAKSIKAPVKALKIINPLTKTAKAVESVGEASKVVVKGVKEVDNLSWIKGLSRFGKIGRFGKVGDEIKEIKTIRRIPFRVPRVNIPKMMPRLPRVRIPRKIPHFELPKLRNPLARMRSIKVFKHVDEIPTVAKATGKAITPKIPKVLKAFDKPVKYGVPIAGALGVGYLMGRDNVFAGGAEGGAEITHNVPDYTAEEGSGWFDWINPFNWFGGSEGGADYPTEGEPYPIGFEPLPPEAGYPDEGYVPPAYVPDWLSPYVEPAEGFAQDVLSAVEPLPVMGDLAGEAKRSGLALPFLIVGGAGAYLAYKHFRKRRGRKK